MSGERCNPWSGRSSPRGRSPTPPPLRRAYWDEPGMPTGGHRPRARPQRSGENLYAQSSPRGSAAPSRRPTPSPNAGGRRYRPLGEGGAEHWTLHKDTDHSSHMNLTKLPHKLTPMNYVSWMMTMESTLNTIKLFEYATGEVPEPDPDVDEARARRWKHANACVRLILASNMTEEVVSQISHLTVAAQVWQEVRRLFAGETLTDWTLLITSLITMKYADGEDLTLHIAKMKAYRRDLILMSRNIPDDLYACFIRISMPQSWNYVFSGLSQYYTSSEIERRLKEEYAIRQNQQSTARAYNAKQQSGKRSKKEYKPGNPFCKNCEWPGHYIKDCWSKGGGAEGKGPRSKKKEKKDLEKQDAKGKERVNEAKEDSDHLSCMAAPGSSSRFTWILDGGSTTHICRTKSAFITFTPSSETIGGIRKTGPQLEVHGRGDILILCHVHSGDQHIVTLRNVCYCPDARDNIISESHMDQKGLSIHKQNGLVAVQNSNGKVIMEGARRRDLYELDCAIAPPSSHPSEISFAAQLSPSDSELWHCRLAHIGQGSLQYMVKHALVTGLDLKSVETLGPCDGCAKGKHHQAPFPKQATNRATSILHHLHMDLQGPFDLSITGYRYTLAVVDDYSCKGWKAFLKAKSDATSEIKDLITRLETFSDKKVKIVRSDGGGEFIGNNLQTYFKLKGIKHETSAPHTPPQNGVAERYNQTTHEHALCMLQEANMSSGFWPEAHAYASLVCNRSPTRALVESTPNEKFYGKKPDVSTLRIFGACCHVRVPPESRKKLDAHSLDGIFCGFAPNQKAYKIWIPSRHKFMVSRDVIVYENVPTMPEDNDQNPALSEGVTASKSTQSNSPDTAVGREPSTTSPPHPPTSQASASPAPAPIPTPPENQPSTASAPTPTSTPTPAPMPAPAPAPLRRSERVTRPSWIKQAAEKQQAQEQAMKTHNKAIKEARTLRRQMKVQVRTAPEPIPEDATVPTTPEGDVAQVAYIAAFGTDTPMNFREATKCSEADNWWTAMHEEIDMLQRRGTWVLEDLPPGRKAIGNRWTYVIKRGPQGEILRYKARLVAQGFSQIPGIDFNDTFSPTVRLESLRAILHLTAAHGWHHGQDDVTGAFLHSKVDVIIYMQQPVGFDDGTGRVCRLLLSLYGLRQSSHLWNEYMDGQLSTISFHRLICDSAIYVRRTETGANSILAIHVDNTLSFSDSAEELASVRKQLHSIFEMKEEDPNWLMGFELIDNPQERTVSISHRQYISTILRRFKMENCIPVPTPMESSLHLSVHDAPSTPEEIAEMKNRPYRELVGALTWISVISRPDVAFVSAHLAQFNANPGKRHWEATK
ncbi:Retrovirus-related Pol polyprotein from transposon TNT 1-94 [Sparassis crispa]|uniref:Retrovirus-related Pol polyprotein from transposon TNT 1-94 n=1 Tax=Sparassis crispa TaxID=139825 RepID=A0A401GYL2_9APHY|nr:Retrovirus-related Pol polyprotein from transposon TNT 1-94 [Sparassis crispa]GBE87258.1 Retrovirus-related Pol polyprotein from transposon TNT 1-94 [Sparassis crispa]